MTILLDEGLMYGIGLFETIAIADGHAILLQAHLNRLNTDLQSLNIQKKIEKEQILSYLQTESFQNGVLKVMVSEKNTIFTTRENPYTEEQFQKGFEVRLSTICRNSTSPFTYLKSFHYGDNYFEKKQARKQGFDEPIFLNEKGQICEGATTNLFFIQNGKIYTPPVQCGLLDGILRQYIIRHYGAAEKFLTMDMLSEIEGVFLTNSLLGIMPVSIFEDVTFSPNEKIQEIRKAYEQRKYQL